MNDKVKKNLNEDDEKELTIEDIIGDDEEILSEDELDEGDLDDEFDDEEELDYEEEFSSEGELPEHPSEEEFAAKINPASVYAQAEQDIAAADKKETKNSDSAKIKEYEEKMVEMQDRTVRAIAEMENLRKRQKKELDDTRKYAVSNIAQDLIAVLENLRRAEQSIPEENARNDEQLKNILIGIQMTSSELLSVFNRHGIERITPEAGEDFDHALHQAVAEVPSEQKAGTVVDVMQAGYIIKDRLLRPAMVTVARADVPSSYAEALQEVEEESKDENDGEDEEGFKAEEEFKA